LNCGAALLQRCTNCQTELLPDARFCMHCGHPVRALSPLDDAHLERLAAAAPSQLADKVRAAPHLSGERRLVTILHIDVVGSTALAERCGDEVWAVIMTEAYDRIAQVIYHYEGTIARLLGDALVAFFGAPVAHEDDPIRAIQAALDSIDLAKTYAQEVRSQYAVDFAVRACLNSGQVVIGPVSTDLRYDFSPVGGAVNLAARIKFAAQPMSVLVSENTYRFITPVFESIDLGPIEVKDRKDPVRVYQVIDRKTDPGKLRGLVGLESPMVGRAAEMASLLNLCETVHAGLGRGVVVVGEPGLGKTRLIQEWHTTAIARLAGVESQWFEGSCLSYGQGIAYHLIINLLYSLIRIPPVASEPDTHLALLNLLEELFGQGESNTYLQEVYPYLGHLLSLKLEGNALMAVKSLDPQTLQNRYLLALRSLLQVITTHSPLIIILEDLHWADPSSIEILIKLLPMALSTPLLFCLVTRAEHETPGWKLVTAAREILGGNLTEITLEALTENESRQLVSNLLEVEALPLDTRSLILQKSEGNPFFVEEVIRMLIDRGAITQKDGHWVAGADIASVEIPDNLQGLLLARIDRLPEEVKHTLRVAAVIGRQFPVKVLEQVLAKESSP